MKPFNFRRVKKSKVEPGNCQPFFQVRLALGRCNVNQVRSYVKRGGEYSEGDEKSFYVKYLVHHPMWSFV